MKFIKTRFQDLTIIEPRIFQDSRGYFFETYQREIFRKNKITCSFVQENQSFSIYGTLRGLHYQKPEATQAKLIKVILGKVLDVVVDLRSKSETFGQVFSIELSAENKKQLFVPRGFAHGFSVLSERALLIYQCDNFYNPKAEAGLRFDDSTLKIDWQITPEKVKLSPKDQQWSSFEDYQKKACF